MSVRLRSRGNKGFTLIEVLVALSLLVLLLGAVLGVYRDSLLEFHRQDHGAEVLENLRIGLGVLSSELRTVTGPLRVDSGGQWLSFSTTDGTVTYYVSNGQLRRAVGGQGHNPVASHIDTLVVSVAERAGGGQLVTLELTGLGGDPAPPQLMTRVYCTGNVVEVPLGHSNTP